MPLNIKHMTIEMNIDYLLKNKITANQFLIIQMLLENQTERLATYRSVLGEDEYYKCLGELINMGFLDANDEGMFVTLECLRTFKGKGYFEEFYAAFPVSVVRPDGKRESLRTAKKMCEKRYRGIARRGDIHEHIMKCLEFEINERTGNDSLKFMKKMPNWLSSEVWLEYEDKMKEGTKVSAIIQKLDDGTNLL